MTKRLQLRRVLAADWGCLRLAFAGLGYRLVDLQVLRHDELAKLAQENTQREFCQRAAPRRHPGCARQSAGHQRSGENGLRRSGR